MIDLSRTKSLFIYLIGSIILVLAGFLIDKSVHQPNNFEKKAERFQEILYRKEAILESYVEKIWDGTDSLYREGYVADRPSFIKGLNQEGLVILIYEEDTLEVWTDHTFPIPPLYNDTLFQKDLIFQGNAWFRARIFEKANRKVVGLVRLKHEYPYENRFLKDGFERGFNLSPNVALNDLKSNQGAVIYDQSGSPLFLLAPGDRPFQKFPGYLISGFYFAGFILVLLFFSKCLALLPGQREKRIALLGLGVLLIQFTVPGISGECFHYQRFYFVLLFHFFKRIYFIRPFF